MSAFTIPTSAFVAVGSGANLSAVTWAMVEVQANSSSGMTMAVGNVELVANALTKAKMIIAFDNMNLKDAKLAEANCTRCSFRNSDLTGASLWHANLKDAILDGANLENADLDFANLNGVSVKGAKIKKTIFPLKGEKIEQIREAARSGRKLRMDTKSLEEDT